MIQSMTGYGRSQAVIAAGTLTVEIRTLNGKSADISIKTSLLPKEREMQVRKMLADRLVRGTIDFFLGFEAAPEAAKGINSAVLRQYVDQVQEALGLPGGDEISKSILATGLMRLPDVTDTRKGDLITPEDWPAVEKAIGEALDALCAFRAQEGAALARDLKARIGGILDLYNQVEAFEGERIATVKERLQNALEALGAKPDPSRFEQELVYYLDKYDITEEKVRLRQHCKYFQEVMDTEPYPGKKLGFILQEIGREVNTTGSKGNHAGIQQLVVQMKDALEKIREQSMNIL